MRENEVIGRRRRVIVLACTALSIPAVGVQARPTTTTPARRPGLTWVQFNDAHLLRPVEHGVDATVDLRTPAGVNDSGRVWRGEVQLPADGLIRFEVEADDGAELWLADTLAIDGWCKPATRACTITGKAGESAPLELCFWRIGGEGYCRLYWSWAGHAREIVPSVALMHDESHETWAREITAGSRRMPLRTADHSAVYQAGKSAPPSSPTRLGPGRYLLVDDHLIEHSEHVARRVNSPPRTLDGPVVSGRNDPGDDCFEPYLSVIQDPQTHRFRMWYGVPESAGQSHIAYMESADGVKWERPHRVLNDPSPIQFGVSVLDEGPTLAKPAERFKFGYYGLGAEGLRIATSPDGLAWKPLADRTLVPHDHDINNIWRDPLRGRYMMIGSTYIEGPRWQGRRRVTIQSVSNDLLNWERPWTVLTPDDSLESGQTQFYAMCGFLACGDLLIGMVKVLHDDYAAEPGGEAAGVGWTSLAWSRDGVHWVRDRDVYFDRNPASGQWDRAMAWIDCQLPVGDDVYLYYGGYARGHKINRFEERQIGLVKMRRDRYVARTAGEVAGLLRTPPFTIDGRGVMLNVDADEGEARVQLVSADGQVIEGFGFDECRPIQTDALDARVSWRRSLTEVKGQTIRIECRLRNASLYALEVD